MKTNTTHVVLTTGRSRDSYSVWSEHRSERAAHRRCADMGRNCCEGHTVTVPVADVGDYIAAQAGKEAV